ncbi:Uncharacterised protein [Yersinia thracica]|uniref:Uncharacterized protein n=1 Tax=Yersinia thracica TaxID=2890319 RepID=A0A0T9NM92_9GAMM|nr:Uncharacterised protein [Yersinia thracica]
MSVKCLKITDGHNNDEEKDEINKFFLKMQVFHTIFGVLLSWKIKNSLEWVLVMSITKWRRIPKIRKRISKIEDT